VNSASLLFVGLILLLGGGTLLVRGASNLATRFGFSPLIIGLTVVAFGTSAPELVVTILASIEDQSHLAYGNLVGSNIANLGLILGAAALVSPLAIQGQLIRREVPLLVIGTAILVVMSMDAQFRGTDNLLTRADSLVLLLLFGIFMYVSIGDLVNQRNDPLLASTQYLRVSRPNGGGWKRNTLLVLAGIAGLSAGAEYTITAGVEIAELLGIPHVVVGIAVIAIGTSLPELVTSIIAVRKGAADLCVGNLIGSNLFNGFLILPIGALINPIAVPDGGAVDMLVSLMFAGALIPIFIFGRAHLGRKAGSILIAVYLVYIIIRVAT